MSSTRHAKEGGPLRQERYCSSPEYEKGLMANLVAKKCRLLESAADRELLYWLQAMSHKEGGLAKLVNEIKAKFPERIVTRAMLKHGAGRKGVYNRAQVEEIRDEIPLDYASSGFLLRGELTWLEEETGGEIDNYYKKLERPTCYPVADFRKACYEASSGLEEFLMRLCLDPALPMEGPWYFATLLETVRECQKEYAATVARELVSTEITKRLFETFEYALAENGLVIAEGNERIGKSKAAQAFCEMNLGRARYVQVPATTDEKSFYWQIARSLGVSINLNSKAQELRQRIEETLLDSPLLVVFDEAHSLWPANNRREAWPHRIVWLMNALVNHGVPVALVATPQFTINQEFLSKKIGWRTGQFIGRIDHFEKLPERLNREDLTGIAKAMLPQGDEKCIDALVNYSENSCKYVAAIEATVKRARYLASKDGAAEITRSYIRRALSESLLPSESALNAALQEARGKAKVKRQFPCSFKAMQSGAALGSRKIAVDTAVTSEARPPAPMRGGLQRSEPEPERVGCCVD